MAAQALGPGTTIVRRRAFFGLLDAGGWAWATLKAAFWFVVIIMLMAYVPDRALYFVVQPTLEIGVPLQTFNSNLNVTPVNLCPASNETLPCPAPVGAVLPWQPNPPELGLPEARTDAAILSAGLETLLVGGTDGTAPSATVFATTIRQDGNIDGWTEGTALPAPRTGAATAFFAGTAYVIGGFDENGQPTTTVFAGTPDAETGRITAWEESPDLALPEGRADATAVVSGEGLFLVGGRNASGPVATAWRAPLNATSGALEAWEPNVGMPAARAGAAAALIGTQLFVWGGEDAAGPTAEVLRGEIAAATTEADAEAAEPGSIAAWYVATEDAAATTNLPEAHRGSMGFVANGILYSIGGDGSDGQMIWNIPDADGNLTGWKSEPASDLPASLGLADAASVVSGSHVFLVGGTSNGTPTQGVARASLTPPQPFFQVGLFYVTIPALGIGGEVGQQLSYLAAAGVATANFVLLILIGYAYNHKAQTRALFDRVRSRRGRAAA
jgi:N-acetylneuraminic acid mutarotase